ncbi:MAG: O-antigen ligase family protein [Anaerolineae bacterium]|nr:O-antigen ligase family protein [Anaerolineae bacterium]MCI0607922.1 O-antigen ligase family protein [Anaerolineae bacterium]
MKNSMLSVAKITRFLWGAALFTLPVTSFRYFPFLGETTYVRPLSFYPIAFLLPLLLIQFWRGKLSLLRAGAVTPLTVFVLFVLAATSLGALLDPLPLRGQEYTGRAIRAWATLIIGLYFFVSAVWMNRSEDDLRFTVTWLMAGFVMDVSWSGVQSLAFYTPLLEKVTVTHWQRAFSMRELVRTNRVSGMAYEPAWLAGQIVTVYLPFLFAALLTRVRVTRFKWLEILLLGFGTLLLLATFSRGGLLIAIVASVLTFLFAGRAELRAVWNWFISGFQSGGKWLLRVGALVLIFGALTGAGFFLSQKGYITRLFNTQAESVEEFIIKNSAGARAAYTFSALGAYNESPLTGVGLGASGLYIYDNLPDWAMTTVPEIARQLSPENRLYPTPKNMYARLLAETGLFGFILYFSFLFSVLGDSLVGLQDNKLFMHYLGIAGLFSLIAIALYNNTQDSFATPNIWLIPGVVTGIISHTNFTAQTAISGAEGGQQ